MIKIVHLITDLATGGAEMMLFRLVTNMDRSRFSNVVVSMTDEGTLGTQFRLAQVPLFTLGMRRGVPDPRGAWRLVKFLRTERPRLIQTWLYHADLLGMLGARVAGVGPIVWNLRCSSMEMQHYSPLSTLVVRLLAKFSPLPTAVVVNSDAGRAVHERMGYNPCRWVTIPNGFDTALFRPDPAAGISLRKELGLSEDTVLVGLVARYDPMKDHHNFISAALELLEECPQVHFVLVGRGVDASNPILATHIDSSSHRESFHLLGEQSDVARILAALDVSASASCGEGFPNVIGEAMACGIPCVVTEVGDSAALVGETGVVVPPRDSRALAQAMGRLIKAGAEERRRLGMAARRRIQDHFALPTIVAQYQRLYEELSCGAHV